MKNKKITIAEARTQAGKSTIAKRTKNRSSHRTLHAPDEIINLLNKIKENQNKQKALLVEAYNDEGYIMAWENGEPYRPNYLSDLFKKIIDDNKLPPLRLHDLRHPYVKYTPKNKAIDISIYILWLYQKQFIIQVASKNHRSFL
ncbi:hypothetical protein LY28_03284 [Ruminiclostridium sufflavum DSM 19573]|uniref:Phage integrase family protein n=1 Tax=Ruminiclostridium sufflavum DSM 19573 TaxID=1121337 RepID=A0A318XIR3_9FIRM|nr:hypothetical protein [Ruminiclostridium sufflavum]PYG85723.1 hypothetical protein LY28_03284 [Ruminiclostridium sufflavum DSM 19573]